jgi:hypothetical protein
MSRSGQARGSTNLVIGTRQADRRSPGASPPRARHPASRPRGAGSASTPGRYGTAISTDNPCATALGRGGARADFHQARTGPLHAGGLRASVAHKVRSHLKSGNRVSWTPAAPSSPPSWSRRSTFRRSRLAFKSSGPASGARIGSASCLSSCRDGRDAANERRRAGPSARENDARMSCLRGPNRQALSRNGGYSSVTRITA